MAGSGIDAVRRSKFAGPGLLENLREQGLVEYEADVEDEDYSLPAEWELGKLESDGEIAWTDAMYRIEAARAMRSLESAIFVEVQEPHDDAVDALRYAETTIQRMLAEGIPKLKPRTTPLIWLWLLLWAALIVWLCFCAKMALAPDVGSALVY